MIQATELPYGVFTNTVIDQLAALTNENESYGIERVVDNTKKTADIRIYLSNGANPNKMITKLYKDTSLENWYSVNMILLDQGRFPKLFGWRAACDAYIAHIRECERNIIQFDLDKALARKNIVDGLIKAYSIIDEVVALIRASANPTEAADKLISLYGFNEEQAKAILAMKLSSLTKLDITKLNNEADELTEKIKWCQYLLNDSTALDNELIKILRDVATKFGDERRTKILDLVDSDLDPQEDLKEEEMGIMLFNNNSMRLVHKDDLQVADKRGKRGVNIKPPKGADLINTLYTTNMSTIAAFTDRGRMYSFPVSDLTLGADCSIYDSIKLQDDEKVILLTDVTEMNNYKYLITISKNGFIKKTNISEYNCRIKKGTAAVKLEESDILIGVYLSNSDEDKILIANNIGNYNLYPLSEISVTGRVTKGVKAIKLDIDNYVCSSTIIRKLIDYIGILTVTTSGRGKITTIDNFNETTRATKGNKVMELKEEELSLVYAIPESQKKIFVSANNKAIILDINSIPIQNRMTLGVSIINAKDNKTEIKIM